MTRLILISGVLVVLGFLLVPSAHAQFSVVSRGPISGGCNPPALGLDFVNNVIYSCGGSPPQWQSSGLSCQGGVFNVNSVLVVTAGGQISCNSQVTIVNGNEASFTVPDNASVANPGAGFLKLADLNGTPILYDNGALLGMVETASQVGVANGIAGLNSSAVLPIAEVVNSLTNCNSTFPILGNQTCGQIDLALQIHPSMTINGTPCTLGGSCSPSGSSGSTLLNTSGPQSAVTGTGSAATLYTFTIPGGTMNSGSCIRATVGFQHTTGTTATTYTWNFGGTAVTSSSSGGTGQGQSKLIICNNGATNSQFSSVFIDSLIGTTVFEGVHNNTFAIDTTTNQTISFQFTVANTDAVTPKSWIVESVH